MKVSCQTQEGASVTFDYNFGENLNEAVQLFGEDVCWAHLRRALILAAQGTARTMIRNGASKDEIVKTMKEWKPGIPRRGKTPEEKFKELWDQMSPEDRARLSKVVKAG